MMLNITLGLKNGTGTGFVTTVMYCPYEIPGQIQLNVTANEFQENYTEME